MALWSSLWSWSRPGRWVETVGPQRTITKPGTEPSLCQAAFHNPHSSLGTCFRVPLLRRTHTRSSYREPGVHTKGRCKETFSRKRQVQSLPVLCLEHPQSHLEAGCGGACL